MQFQGLIWDGSDPIFSVYRDGRSLSQQEAFKTYGEQAKALLRRMKLVNGSQWDSNHHGAVGFKQLDDTPLSGGSLLAGEILVRTRTPNFEKRKAAGEIIMTPFDRYRSELSQTPGVEVISGGAIYDSGYRAFHQNTGITPVKATGSLYKDHGGFNFKRISGTFEQRHFFDLPQMKKSIGEPVLDPGFLEKRTGLITQTVAEANSGTYDLLTELAELPETVKYMYGLVGDAARAAKAAKSREVEILRLAKRKGMTVIQIADAVASVWMQFRYAISPIVYSLEDIQVTLESFKRLFARYRSREVSEVNLGPDEDSFWDSVTIKSTHRCLIKRSYSPEHLVDALLQVLKLNPVTTAWELVPLSFVVDWFLNIGDLLGALFGPNHEYLQSVASYSVKTEMECTFTSPSSGATLVYKADRYTRDVIDPSALIGLTAAVDMNLFRALDSLALGWFATRGSLLDLERQSFSEKLKSSRRRR